MHDRVSVNALCFLGSTFMPLPLAEVAGYWRDLRPHRVSFVGDLVAGDAEAARAVVEEGGYKVETITHGFMPGRQLEPAEESWVEPRAGLSKMIETAASLGARSIYGLTGGRGALTWEEAADCFSRAIAPCAEQAKAVGIALMIENASPLYADSHIGNSLRDTVALTELAGIGVCIDIFGCWTEAGLRETIERAVPRCALIQVSDYVYGDRSLPGRAVPGDGAIPLQRIIDWALSAGYDGAFDLELIGPRIEQEGRVQAARRAAENVSEILESLGA